MKILFQSNNDDYSVNQRLPSFHNNKFYQNLNENLLIVKEKLFLIKLLLQIQKEKEEKKKRQFFDGLTPHSNLKKDK